MKTIKFIVLAIVISIFGVACNKDKGTDTTSVKVRLTDAPGNFQQVNVEIIGVEFKINGGAEVNMNVNSGIYNLLDFANGVDTLIASADVPSGTLSQIRLILGTNNSIMVDSVVRPLATPSAMQSGLKLNVHSELTAGVEYEILLDFDANQSIVKTGNGDYQLKPVIRTVAVAENGSVHGTVATLQALPATVTATDGTNSYSTITDANGGFLLQGLPAGNYTVTITPQAPYNEVTISNVVVTTGSMTELGVINF